MKRRLPGTWTTPLVLLGLGVLHLLFADALESIRVRVLGTLASFLPAVALPAEGAVQEVSQKARERIAEALRAQEAAQSSRPFRVLDNNIRTRRMIVLAGARLGVRVGSVVSNEHGVLGQVIRTTQHLCLVRYLSDPQQSLAVEASIESRPLPGGIAEVAGILVGDGHAARLEGAFLPRELRAGDALFTEETHPVGVVDEASARPRVRLFADPAQALSVAIDGARSGKNYFVPFDEIPAQLVLLGQRRGNRALAKLVESGPEVPVGSAVFSKGHYLGSVIEVHGNFLVIGQALDGDQHVSAGLLEGEGPLHAGRVRGLGRVFQFEATKSGLDPELEASSSLIVSLGAQDPIPAGLVFSDAGAPTTSWPEDLRIAAFRHAGELIELRKVAP